MRVTVLGGTIWYRVRSMQLVTFLRLTAENSSMGIQRGGEKTDCFEIENIYDGLKSYCTALLTLLCLTLL